MIFPFVLTDDSTSNDPELGLTSDTTTSGGVIDGDSYELENISSSASGFTFSKGTGKTGDNGAVFTDTTENSLDSSTSTESQSVFSENNFITSEESTATELTVSNVVSVLENSTETGSSLEDGFVVVSSVQDSTESSFLSENSQNIVLTNFETESIIAELFNTSIHFETSVASEDASYSEENIESTVSNLFNGKTVSKLGESSIKQIFVNTNTSAFGILIESAILSENDFSVNALSSDVSTTYENALETSTVLPNSVENSGGVEGVSNFVNTAFASEIFSRAIESQIISPEILYNTSEFGFLTENAWIDEVAVSVVKGITADSIAWEGVDIHARQSYNSNEFGQLAESSIKSISVKKNSTELSELGESTFYIIDVINQLSDGAISTEKLLLVSSTSQSSSEIGKSYEDRFVKTSTSQTSSEIGKSYEDSFVQAFSVKNLSEETKSYEDRFVQTSTSQASSEIGKSYEDGSAKLEGRSETDEFSVGIERRSVVAQSLYDILDESLLTDSLNMSIVTSLSSEHTRIGKDSSGVEFSIILSQDDSSTAKDAVTIEIDPSLGVESTIRNIIKTFDIVGQMDNDVVITATFDMENSTNTVTFDMENDINTEI